MESVNATGAYLDPLADKLMVTVSLIMLVPLGWAPTVNWVLCRELHHWTYIIASNNCLGCSPLGKTKTAYQSTAFCMLLWHYPDLLLFGTLTLTMRYSFVRICVFALISGLNMDIPITCRTTKRFETA